MHDLWNALPDEEPEQRRRFRDQARRAAEDLRDVARNPAGFRTLLGLLRRLGGRDAPGPDPAACALRAVAEELLDELGAADPDLCLSLIAALRGLPRTTQPQQQP